MHSCQDIEENICFSNGGTNLHIHAIAQGRPGDNQVEFLQGPHGIVNSPKNLVLNNIRRFTMEHIGAANGLTGAVHSPRNHADRSDLLVERSWRPGSCALIKLVMYTGARLWTA